VAIEAEMPDGGHNRVEIAVCSIPVLLASTRFLPAYVRKQDDGRYHVFPSISSENWGCTIDFKLNKDCILDVSLIRFVLDATVKASKVLGENVAERASWEEISGKLAAYPIGHGPYGEVWLDILNALSSTSTTCLLHWRLFSQATRSASAPAESSKKLRSAPRRRSASKAGMTSYRSPSAVLGWACLS
jgi:hypothetical protein